MRNLFYVLLILLCSCGEHNANRSTKESIVIETNIISETDAEKFFPETFVVELDTNTLLGDILDLCLYDSSLYVIDDQTKAIAQFKYPSGKLIKKHLSIGNGPEEYLQPIMLDIKDNELFILDFSGCSILKYDQDLNFISKIKTEHPMTDFVCSSEGIICYNSFIPEGQNSVSMYSYDGVLIKKMDFATQKSEVSYKGKVFLKDKDMIYFRPKFCDQIYVFGDSARSFSPYVKIDFQDKSIPPNYEFKNNIFNSQYAILTHVYFSASNCLISYTLENERIYSFESLEKNVSSYRFRKKESFPFFPQWQFGEYLISLMKNDSDNISLVFHRLSA